MSTASDDSDFLDHPYARKQTPEQALRRAFFNEQLNGRTYLDQSAYEYSLQAFTNCLHMCVTNTCLADLKYEVLANIGWVNRLMGRYTLAVQYLQDALALADSLPGSATPKRHLIDAELGTVFRLTDRHEEARNAFARQYAFAKKLMAENEDDESQLYYWKRVACRAVGNLGMANYQRALQILSEAAAAEDFDLSNSKSKSKEKEKEIKQKAQDLLQESIAQIEERLQLATELATDDPNRSSHGHSSRERQARCWQCIAYSRLSLCHTALADLESTNCTERKKTHLTKALELAKAGTDLAWGESAVISLSRFFYGRVLLKWAEFLTSQNTSDDDKQQQQEVESYKSQAVGQFGPMAEYGPRPGYLSPWEVATAAIALAMEPCTEHRGYLKELVDCGADFEATDPKSGYTALDYAVFSGDTGAEEIILLGLGKQYRQRTGRDMSNRQIENLKKEARLRKGYREIFQERLRPELMRGFERIDRWKRDEETVKKNRATRRRALRDLRRMYARALDEPGAGMQGMFDRLKVITYRDFVEFGRLPRSSDGLAVPFEASSAGNADEDEDDDDGEFVIFFSYRWINKDKSLDSPDDRDRTQYKRMVDAVESLLERQDGLVSREKFFIWMDFACVDQDNPAAGVASLPLIIAQCDAVITLQDETYFDRAWCCVEATMIQTLQSWYGLHEWLEQVPYTDSLEENSPDKDGEAKGKARADNSSHQPQDTDTSKENAPKWLLRKTKAIHLPMADKKLSYETDRPKVLFLERQTNLLRRQRVEDIDWPIS